MYTFLSVYHHTFRENVRVNGFGVFVMLIYPGAFVDLHTEHLQALNAIGQLRIYCAGVWHNFLLVIWGVVVLMTMPYLLSPLYLTGNGVVITEVSPVSISINNNLCFSD